MKKLLPILALAFLLNPLLVFADETINFAGSQNDNTAFGLDVPNDQRSARSFTPSGNDGTATLTVSLFKNGTPGDNVVVQIQADVAGSPSGVSLGSASIAASSLTTSCANYTFPAISSLALLGGIKYWLVLTRSGALDDTNRYRVCILDGDISPVTKTYTGAVPAWVNQTFGDWFGSLALVSSASASISPFILFFE